MATTAFLLWVVVKSSTGERPAEKNFTEFMSEVNKDEVREVTIAGTEVTGVFKNNQKFKTTIPANYPDLYKTLLEKNVNVTNKDNSGSSWLTWVGIGLLPMIILVGFWIFFMRQIQSCGNKALSFGKSRARLLSSQQK
jgi:cell division protease FtsH